jgi:hypothetical protein
MNGNIVKQVCIGKFWRGTIIHMHDPRLEKPYVLYVESPVGTKVREEPFALQLEATAYWRGAINDVVEEYRKGGVFTDEIADQLLKEVADRHPPTSLN